MNYEVDEASKLIVAKHKCQYLLKISSIFANRQQLAHAAPKVWKQTASLATLREICTTLAERKPDVLVLHVHCHNA